MTLWINEVKNSDLRKLGGDMANTNARLTFTEAVYKLEADGNQGLLTAYVTEASDVKGMKGIEFKEGVYLLHFTLKEFKKEWKDNEGQMQSKMQKSSERDVLWHSILTAAMEGNVGIKGHINLGCNLSSLQSLESGKTVKGQDWKEIEPLADLLYAECKLEPVEALDKLKDVSVGGNKGNYGGGKPAQTELAKLNDRLAFVLAQFPSLLADCKTLEDVASACSNAITSQMINDTLKLIIK